jgi:hypothetical protein
MLIVLIVLAWIVVGLVVTRFVIWFEVFPPVPNTLILVMAVLGWPGPLVITVGTKLYNARPKGCLSAISKWLLRLVNGGRR